MLQNDNKITELLNKLSMLKNPTSDKIETVFTEVFPRENQENINNYNHRTSAILLQAMDNVMDQVDEITPENPDEFMLELAQSIRNGLKETLKSFNNNNSHNYIELLAAYCANNPIQTLAAVYTHNQDVIGNQLNLLLLLMMLQPLQIEPEIKPSDDLYQKFVTQWQPTQSEQVAEPEQAIAASSSASSSTTTPEIKEPINRAHKKALKYVTERQERLNNAKRWALNQKEQKNWSQIQISINKDDHPDYEESPFMCSINDTFMENGGWLYNDGRTYSNQFKETNKKDISPNRDVATGFKDSYQPNTALASAEKKYEQLVYEFEQICQAYPDMPITMKDLAAAVEGLPPLPSTATNSTQSSSNDGKTSQSSNEQNEAAIAASSTTPTANKAEKSDAEKNLEKQALDYYLVSTAAVRYINSLITDGEINGDNPEVKKLLSRYNADVEKCQQNFSEQIRGLGSDKTRTVNVVLTIPKTTMNQYTTQSGRMVVLQTKQSNSNTSLSPAEDDELLKIISKRRALRTLHPFIDVKYKINAQLEEKGIGQRMTTVFTRTDDTNQPQARKSSDRNGKGRSNRFFDNWFSAASSSSSSVAASSSAASSSAASSSAASSSAASSSAASSPAASSSANNSYNLREKNSIPKKPTTSGSANRWANPDFKFNVLMAGPRSSGASCLLLQFADGTFTESFISTIGVDHKSRRMDISGHHANLQVWDKRKTSSAMHGGYVGYRNVHAFVVTFDMTDKDNFREAQQDVVLIRKSDGYVAQPIILVATKLDLSAKRVISAEQAQSFAEENEITYLEASAKTGANVNLVFEQAAIQILLGNPDIMKRLEQDAQLHQQIQQIQANQKSAEEGNPLVSWFHRAFK